MGVRPMGDGGGKNQVVVTATVPTIPLAGLDRVTSRDENPQRAWAAEQITE